jgi:hypothetical protein
MTGPIFGHYFTQLVPGLSMLAAAAFLPSGKTFALSKADWAKFVFGSILIAIAIFRTAAAEWSALAQRLWRGEPLSYGIEYAIADYIKSQQIEDFSLFMTDNHLVYWLLGRYPPTPLATHPSNLRKPFMRRYLEPDSQTTQDALQSVFRREPTFVLWFPPDFNPTEISFVERELANTYTLVAQFGLAQVYRRRSISAPRY